MGKVVAIVQARMGSTRLPGKVMMDLGGYPVLDWVAHACKEALGVDDVYVATSMLPADDVIAKWCVGNGWNVWRGPEDDVLSRFVGAAMASDAEVVLRITGDCPLMDPAVIDGVIRLHKATGAPFVTNVSPRTYPDGLDVQLMTREALLLADKMATRPLDRDGVCTWIERNRSRLPAETLICPIPGLAKERWVLDTAADFKFCAAIIDRCCIGRAPSMYDVLDILDKEPELRKINGDGVMNERYFDALAEEPLYERSYQRSQEALARAEKFIPLGAQTFSKSKLQYPQPSPLFLTHEQGALVWDVDGNEYVDLVSALLPNILGYRDPDVDAAIRRQLSAGLSFSLATELEAELAETLCRLIPCAEAVRFGKSGTDATTAAVRLARAYTKREKVLVCGYHGWSDWSMSVSEHRAGIPAAVQALSLKEPEYGQIPWGDPGDVPAAIIIEPEGDVAKLHWLRAMCSNSGVVLIFDEVITGFRFDIGGAQKLYGVTPDLACFGKAMANGMPLSAVVGRKDIMKLMAPPDNIFYSGTFFGETLSLAAGIATIRKLERENILPKLWDAGEKLTWNIKRLLDQALDGQITLHGEPPFKRLKFASEDIAALFRREMVNSGTLITASNNLSAAHGEPELKRVLKSYEQAISVVRAAVEKGDIKQRLAGATIGPGVR